MANLVKLNIPVTQENIEQYEAYTHYERNMAGQLDSLPSALSDTLTQLTGQDPVQAGAFLKNVTAALYEGLPQEMQAGLSETMPQDAVREGLAQKSRKPLMIHRRADRHRRWQNRLQKEMPP